MRMPTPALLVLAGCGAFSNYQAARTLPPNRMQTDASAAALPGIVQTDMRMRVPILEGLDAGVGVWDFLLLGAQGGEHAKLVFSGDVKCRILNEEAVPDPDPYSLALSAGYRKIHWYSAGYVQVTGSRQVSDWLEPFVALRVQKFSFNLDLMDPEDRDYSDDNGIYGRDFRGIDRTRLTAPQLFLGAKLHMAPGFALVPEVSIVTVEGERFLTFGLGFVWEYDKPAPMD